MIFFRVTQNINIKTTDGNLVQYSKFKMPSNLNNETVYISTYNDYNDLIEVFANVDKNKYHARLLKEDKVRALEEFPIELGISNHNEYLNYQNFKEETKENFSNDEKEISSFLQSTKQVNLFTQLKNLNKNEISIVIIGKTSHSIGEMVASCTALRILYNKLNEIYKSVKMDIYLEASNNSFYSRDKEIFKNQTFINKVFPLSLTAKKLCEYDYFIDNSCVEEKSSYYNELNCIDAWLYKFGIDYKEIPNELKYNKLDLKNYKVSNKLKDKLDEAKNKGKLLLFHPYSANLEKSIPQEIAIDILRKLQKKLDGFTIVSTLSISSKLKDDSIIDLSKESKYFNDFAYIISNMDGIISTDTSTYHIADAFMIPTIVLFTKSDSVKNMKYYQYVKAIEIQDKSRNFSKFIFENDVLTFYKFSSWKKLKISKIIKLLDKF